MSIHKITVSTPERKSGDELNYKSHSEDGIHLLVGTDAAPTGNYYGFIAGDSMAITSITYNKNVENGLVSGDTQFTTTILITGAYYTIPGGFTTITLSAGDAILLKKSH